MPSPLNIPQNLVQFPSNVETLNLAVQIHQLYIYIYIILLLLEKEMELLA